MSILNIYAHICPRESCASQVMSRSRIIVVRAVPSLSVSVMTDYAQVAKRVHSINGSPKKHAQIVSNPYIVSIYVIHSAPLPWERRMHRAFSYALKYRLHQLQITQPSGIIRNVSRPMATQVRDNTYLFGCDVNNLLVVSRIRIKCELTGFRSIVPRCAPSARETWHTTCLARYTTVSVVAIENGGCWWIRVDVRDKTVVVINYYK